VDPVREVRSQLRLPDTAQSGDDQGPAPAADLDFLGGSAFVKVLRVWPRTDLLRPRDWRAVVEIVVDDALANQRAFGVFDEDPR
jgi:hypothetical protein